MKKKGLIIAAVVVAAVIFIIAAVSGGYNGLISSQSEAEAAFSEISVQLQRRADLIPNFVNTVKGYSDYEQETFTAVTEARSRVSRANDAGELAEADSQLSGAISVWVNAITEAYPELKANQSYIALQDELAGTENRIAQARISYNEAAKEYNVKIRRFPRNILAGIFGFDALDYFEASAGAENVPQVSFD